MGKQGRPAKQVTPIFVTQRVPIIRFGDFCQKYRTDIMSLLADCDDKPRENIKISNHLALWMNRLQNNGIPVYCHNRYHSFILKSLYRQYRDQGNSLNKKTIQITCFPKNVNYKQYQCWYIHANKKNDLIPDFCLSCRQRLDEHLGKNFYPSRIPYDRPYLQIPSVFDSANTTFNHSESIKETIMKIEAFGQTENTLQHVKVEENNPENQVSETKRVENRQVEPKTAILSSTSIMQVHQAKKKRKLILKGKTAKRRVEKMEVIAEVKMEEDDSMSLM